MLHFAKSSFLSFLVFSITQPFFKVKLKCSESSSVAKFELFCEWIKKINQKTKTTPKPIVQMNLKYVLPEDKIEYIAAGCWWGRARLWWDEDEIILWWFVLRSIPVSCCGYRLKLRTWGGKKKSYSVVFLPEFSRMSLENQVCESLQGVWPGPTAGPAPAGILCCPRSCYNLHWTSILQE